MLRADSAGRGDIASMQGWTADDVAAKVGDASEAIVLATSGSAAPTSAAISAEEHARDELAGTADDVRMIGDRTESGQPPAKRAAFGPDQPMAGSNDPSDSLAAPRSDQ